MKKPSIDYEELELSPMINTQEEIEKPLEAQILIEEINHEMLDEEEQVQNESSSSEHNNENKMVS